MIHRSEAVPGRAAQVVGEYGRCLELVPMDPHFHGISVGLYARDGVATVWSFSRRPGVEDRIRQVRDRLVELGGMAPVQGSHNQAAFPCGDLHGRPLRFLIMQAVEKAPDYSFPDGPVKDTRSALMLSIAGAESGGRWVYRVSAEGDAPNAAARVRAVASGFRRYGEAEVVGEGEVSFPCGGEHGRLARLLLPYARNVSMVEDMLESAALRGQLTTGTAGFTPT
ncbi:MAG: hypothetical protein J4F43_10300 [Dehalococcoidia bacterium]|nr:hypothetical protein [Dehalococcoidia bacterium]